MATITVKGDVQTIARLAAIPDKISKRVLGKAANAGGRELLKAARKRAPRSTGGLARSLDINVKKYPDGAAAIIGQLRSGRTVENRRNKFRLKIQAGKGGRRRGGISGRGEFVPLHLVENKVAPHGIARRNAAAMAIDVPGGVTFARAVSHPGHAGRGFAEQSETESRGAALSATERRLRSDVDAEFGKLSFTT